MFAGGLDTEPTEECMPSLLFSLRELTKAARVIKQWVGNTVRGKLAAPKRSCMEKNLGSLINFGNIAEKTK